jgi:hypothetical protein
MTERFKAIAAIGLTGLLLAGVGYFQRSSSPASRPASWAGERTLDPEARRGAQLDKDGAVLLWSMTAKGRIAEAVARRRLGLVEGAAALRAIDGSRPARLRPGVPADHQGLSEDERYCRSMLVWVRGKLQDGVGDPVRVTELGAELGEFLNRPGPLRLPDVALDRCLPPDLLPAPSMANTSP